MKGKRQIWKQVILNMVGSIFVVCILFAFSDHIIHKRNSFTRLFPPHLVVRESAIDLKLNSFYIAGIDKNLIYLSNLTAPLYLLEVNLNTLDTISNLITLPKGNVSLKTNTKVAVQSPYFYIMDGVTPQIFKGRLGEWKAHLLDGQEHFFSVAVPIDSNSIAIRAVSAHKPQYVIGKLSISPPGIELNSNVLTPQLDGIFSTDGILQYNQQLQELIYLYYYRNQYLITDSSIKIVRTGSTIDTNRIAKINVSSLKSGKVQKLSSPPLLVNKFSSSYGRYLFVCSNLMAKNGHKKSFQNSDVVDVYNTLNQEYEFSFYLPHFKGYSINGFAVTGEYLVAVHHHNLVTYRLSAYRFKMDQLK